MARHIVSSSASSSATSGIGFFGLATLVLMTLKLLDKIDVSWFVVFLPVMIPFIILLGIGLVFLAVLIFGGKK